MQAIKNKLHLNKNKDTTTTSTGKHSLFGKHNRSAVPETYAPAVTSTSTTATLPTQTFDQGFSSIPQAPPAPAMWAPERAEYYNDLERLGSWNRGTGFSGMSNWNGSSWNNTSSSSFNEFSSIPQAPPAPAMWSADRQTYYDDLETLGSWNRGSWSGLSNSSYGSSSTYSSTNFATAGVVLKENLPVEIIEKPMVIHEEIRREQLEEIQPVINVEKFQTEVHQVTQPLFDKEIKPVLLEQRTLNTEVLPEVILPGRGISAAADVSSIHLQDTAAVVVEKPAIYNEVDRLQVIEEIQPVLYKETVVPTVIQETKPIFQKIVEGASYSQETLAPRILHDETLLAKQAYQPTMVETAPVLLKENLPVEIIEKPVVVHEEIRREQVEEIQPVVNIEKFQTEVHQVTQPLFDKEIKPVIMERRTLASEVLPEVLLPGRGISAVADVSSTAYLDSKEMIIEKPAIYTEIDKLQVIEEIQPVLYKETIVPSVIQETKPIYQKIVEGPVYVQTVLPAQSLMETQYRSLHTSTWTQETLFSNNASGLSSGLNNMSLNSGRAASTMSPVIGQKAFVPKTFSTPATQIDTLTQTTQTTTSAQSNLPTYAL